MSGPHDPGSDTVTHRDDEAAAPVRRSQFLRRGTAGGLVLMAGGGVLALAACGDGEGTGSGRGSGAAATAIAGGGDGDARIARLAATAELLAIDFYGKGIASGLFKGDVLAYLRAARGNEQDHYDALAMVLGSDVPRNLSFAYPDGTFRDARSAAATGAALEEAFVGAYLGAVGALSDPGLKKVAAQIGANEAQHLTTLRSLEAERLVPSPSLPKVLTAQQATEAVTPFLA